MHYSTSETVVVDRFYATLGDTLNPWAVKGLQCIYCMARIEADQDVAPLEEAQKTARSLSENSNFFSNQGILENKHSHMFDITSIIF